MSKEHDALKQTARKILTDMGFTEDEIQEEYTVGQQALNSFRVDVVGISQNRKVAIECGNTPGEKIAALKMFFDDVIVLPYFTINTEQALYNQQIMQLKKEVEILKQRLTNKEEEIKKKVDTEQEKVTLLQNMVQASKELFRASIELSTRYITSGNLTFADRNKTNIELLDHIQQTVNSLRSRLKEDESEKAVNFL